MVPSEPPAPERVPSLSRRAALLGAVGVLAAAALVATLGFTSGHHASNVLAASATPTASATHQLPTYSLSEERRLEHLPRP